MTNRVQIHESYAKVKIEEIFIFQQFSNLVIYKRKIAVQYLRNSACWAKKGHYV